MNYYNEMCSYGSVFQMTIIHMIILNIPNFDTTKVSVNGSSCLKIGMLSVLAVIYPFKTIIDTANITAMSK